MNKAIRGLIAVGVITGSFLIGWLLKPGTSSVVVINLHEIMAKPAMALAKSRYSEAEQKTIMKQYARLLKPVIERYAHDHHQSVINAQVIADGAQTEITDDIVNLTLEAVKHG